MKNKKEGFERYNSNTNTIISRRGRKEAGHPRRRNEPAKRRG